jgi:hypothetical protein
MSETEWDLTKVDPEPPAAPAPGSGVQTKPFDLEQGREETRGDLARGLLYLLTFAIGGVLVFIGTGRLDGTVLTQSVFPSLIALAGTALGFYFGSQSANGSGSAGRPSPAGSTTQGRSGPPGSGR